MLLDETLCSRFVIMFVSIKVLYINETVHGHKAKQVSNADENENNGSSKIKHTILHTRLIE